MIRKGAIRNKVIHQQSLGVSNAIANKRHQVTVMNTADDFNFSSEFTVALTPTNRKLLHCNNLTRWQVSFINTSKPTFSKKVRSCKSIRGRVQLIISEPWSGVPNTWGALWEWWDNFSTIATTTWSCYCHIVAWVRVRRGHIWIRAELPTACFESTRTSWPHK